MDSSYADFEWDGKEFKKRIDELIDRTPIAEASAPPSGSRRKVGRSPAGQSKSVEQLALRTRPGRGGRTQGLRLPDDSSPDGTVVDGMKKVVTATPFGSNCRWEPAK